MEDQAAWKIKTKRQKIVLIGDVKTGKTSILNRFVENKFNDEYDVLYKIIKAIYWS